MPFVLRQVSPVHLSRRSSSTNNDPGDEDFGDPRTSISNATLSACLRQLASLVSLAGDIFGQCHLEADEIRKRTESLRSRLDKLTEIVSSEDSRTVPIRKSLIFFPFFTKAAKWNIAGEGPFCPQARHTQIQRGTEKEPSAGRRMTESSSPLIVHHHHVLSTGAFPFPPFIFKKFFLSSPIYKECLCANLNSRRRTRISFFFVLLVGALMVITLLEG